MSLNGRVWSYDVEDDGTATVTDVSPATGAITIPTILGGCPVTGVGGWAFEGCGSLTSVTIGAGVTNIGWDAFYDCTGLKAVTFLGNAPTDEEVEIVAGDLPNGCTVYVPRGSTGWGVPIPGTWCGHPIRYSVGDVSTSPLTFAKTKVSVKESVAYVDVTVNRVDKDGRVRVKYATADDTAKAGEDYAETTGVLAWADGDKKAKKIRIPLVPTS